MAWPQLGCPIFASYIFSKRNEAKQKPFRFLFSLFRETNKIIFGYFSLRLLKLFRLFSLNFLASKIFDSLCFASFGFLLIFLFRLRIKFTLVITIYENNEHGICCRK